VSRERAQSFRKKALTKGSKGGGGVRNPRKRKKGKLDTQRKTLHGYQKKREGDTTELQRWVGPSEEEGEDPDENFHKRKEEAS